MSLKIVEHATCTFCGCVCDDIELHAEGDASSRPRTRAAWGNPGSRTTPRNASTPTRSSTDSRPRSMTPSMARPITSIGANMPLVYGLSNITCEAQREAVALAEMIGGVIDSHTSL